jgi:hypothetical protein
MSAFGTSRHWGRCGTSLLSACSGSRASVREHTLSLMLRHMIIYATSRSVVSSAPAFGARRFPSMAMVAPMLSLRTLRLRANTG